MKRKFTVKITKTYWYYGYPEARGTYEFKSQYFTGEVEYYGYGGFDIPKIKAPRRCNGSVWESQAFMEDFYSHDSKIRKACESLKKDESIEVVLEY